MFRTLIFGMLPFFEGTLLSFGKATADFPLIFFLLKDSSHAHILFELLFRDRQPFSQSLYR